MIRLHDINITPDMLNKIAELDAFKASWVGGVTKLTPDELNVMKRVATIESVGSSNRIEGNKMTDAEVETLFNQISKKSFQSRDEEEVAGYADLINTIFESYHEIPLSENFIKQLHQILLAYSSKDVRHRGDYKKVSNRVAAFDPDGREVAVVFETASPFDTPRMMRELIEWTNSTMKDRYLHPILTIGIFIVHFLSIHPFMDGNGRLSRALTVLLLLQNGYTYMPYVSMESIIESSKDAYYRALRGTQKTIWRESVNYEPWLGFFVTSLQKQKRALEDKITLLQCEKKDKLSGTALSVLALFSKKEILEMREIVTGLDKNPETIRKAVQVLVKKGYLKKQGTTKGVHYEVRRDCPRS